MRLPPDDDLIPDPPHYSKIQEEMEREIIEAVTLEMTLREIEELYDTMVREGWL